MTDFFTSSLGTVALFAVIGVGCFGLGIASQSKGQVAGSVFRTRESKMAARNLAMQAVLALDDYVGACYAAVHDVPEFNPADQVEFAFHVPEPILSFPKEVDWHLLGKDLGEEIMWFSNRVSNVESALESLDLSRNHHDGFFERRIEGYARLAVRAMDLIARICGEFELTMPEKPEYYRQAEGLSNILRNVEAAAERRGDSTSAGETTNVTPLFPKTS
ncbi:hypothetical protein AAIH70_15825 [Neorhizobium sp. BT27B]|uniref:hypothetical protein n=1 Tax=Neorhizobium sp. BT27B TaxID=3142625 RepID=UPI003D2933C5